MVAYSFHAMFAPDIVARIKCQTIRRPRPRHAYPGERIQLYQGMRTRSCRKIIPDPVCIGIDALVLDMRSGALDLLEINDVAIDPGSQEAEDFCRRDGFGAIKVSPVRHFATYWCRAYGPALHDNLVVIRWEDRP